MIITEHHERFIEKAGLILMLFVLFQIGRFLASWTSIPFYKAFEWTRELSRHGGNLVL